MLKSPSLRMSIYIIQTKCCIALSRHPQILNANFILIQIRIPAHNPGQRPNLIQPEIITLDPIVTVLLQIHRVFNRGVGPLAVRHCGQFEPIARDQVGEQPAQ